MSSEVVNIEAKSKPSRWEKLLRQISYVTVYTLIFFCIWIFVDPYSVEAFSKFNSATVRLIVIWLLLGVFFLLPALLGVLGLVTWILGFLWFPVGKLLQLFGLIWKFTKFTYKIYNNNFLKVFMTISCILCVTIGLLNTNSEFGLLISGLSGLCVLYVIVRITHKAFSPMGLMGKLVEYVTSVKTNYILRALEGMLAKNEKTIVKVEVRIKNFSQILSLILKVPKVIENPKIPLIMFLFTFIPAVFVTVALFAVLYKGLLLNSNISFSNNQYLLMSVYQFAGSNFHGFASVPEQIYWFLAFQSLVAFYFSVVVILAFGVTAQVQTNILSKKMNDYINMQLDDAYKVLPQKISETYSSEERQEIQIAVGKIKNST